MQLSLAVSYLAGRLYGTWASNMGGLRAFIQLAVEWSYYIAIVILTGYIIIVIPDLGSPTQGITNDFIWNP